MQPFILTLTLISLSLPAYALSEPSPQAIALLEYCSPIESDHTDYSVKLRAAEVIFNKMPKPFTECYIDKDCVEVSAACGTRMSVALMAKSCFQKANDLYSAVIDCEPINDENVYRPKCIKNKCTLEISE